MQWSKRKTTKGRQQIRNEHSKHQWKVGQLIITHFLLHYSEKKAQGKPLQQLKRSLRYMKFDRSFKIENFMVHSTQFTLFHLHGLLTTADHLANELQERTTAASFFTFKMNFNGIHTLVCFQSEAEIYRDYFRYNSSDENLVLDVLSNCPTPTYLSRPAEVKNANE